MNIQLPEDRSSLEQLIEAAIARLDEMDGDPDLEPTLGAPAPHGTPCADLGRWMAEQLGRLADCIQGRGELHRVPQLSQAHWAEGSAVDEAEEVSEDEGAQEEREPEEETSDGGTEDEGSFTWWAMRHYRAQLGHFDSKAAQRAQDRTVEACRAAVEVLRTVQRRAGRKPVQQLRTVCGAIMR